MYQIKVTLKGSKPPIWRRMQGVGNTTLTQLHLLSLDPRQNGKAVGIFSVNGMAVRVPGVSLHCQPPSSHIWPTRPLFFATAYCIF
jgi:hypothetical protein